MATNTAVLIVVTALAAVVLAGMLVGVAYKTRTQQRNITGETIRDQTEEDALRLRRREALADEYAARAHAAEVDIDIKTIRGDIKTIRGLPPATATDRPAHRRSLPLNGQSDDADNRVPRRMPRRPGSLDDLCHFTIGKSSRPDFDFSPFK
jgi:hypothetical protein